MEVKEISNECKDLVEKICQKFGYNDLDKDGNDSLKTILLKIIPIMLKDSTQEERNLFYEMLSHTPIVVVDKITQEGYDNLREQYIGKNLNQHIIEDNVDLGEYGKGVASGAYVAEPIIDENMNLQGKKSFIYIQKVPKKAKELLGTDINVPHLIHELGHAWHAEKEQYIIQSDGTLKERIGTGEFIYDFKKTNDNKIIKKCIKTAGIMIEESMNTKDEEIAMANYLGISLEEMHKTYRNILVPSNYQGYMTNFITYMLEQFGKDDLENYRLYGDVESKNKLNELMEKTNYWKNRETEILPNSDSPRSYSKKREVIDRINKTNVQDFFENYKDIYFPDISKMTPLEKIDNVLEQQYSMNMIKYSMGIDNYRDFLYVLAYEGYGLINQTADLIKLNEKQVQTKGTIEPKDVVISALKQRITKSQVLKANNIEHSNQISNIKEGEINDD